MNQKAYTHLIWTKTHTHIWYEPKSIHTFDMNQKAYTHLIY